MRAALTLVTRPLLRALEQKKGRRRYLAGPPRGGPPAESWRGRRLDYITYRSAPGGLLSPVSARAQGMGLPCWGDSPTCLPPSRRWSR